MRDKNRKIPIYTLEGVRDADITTHWFPTEDKLSLSLLRFCRQPSKNPVLLMHGLTTSTDMFIQPEHENVVNVLLDNGYTDVWSLDYRMSNRHYYNLVPNRYSMDDVALYDHPAALATMRGLLAREDNADASIHVVAHCLGAMTFGMALFGGVLGEHQRAIRSCIANSVFLTPHVPLWSLIKGHTLPWLLEWVFQQPFVSPRWRDEPGFRVSKLISWLISLAHPECKVPACHMLSEMWGAGFPGVYRHENMHEITHERIGDLFGAVGMNYHIHNMKMARKKRTVRMHPKDERFRDLTDDYLANTSKVDLPILLVSGDKNRVFINSNSHCYAEFEKRVPGRHRLHLFEGYGHQDVFQGKDVARDIFPTLLEFLNQHRVPESRAAA